MAVKIIDREYRDLYRPDENFNFLLGNVGDWQRLKLRCEVASEILGSNSETFTIDTEQRTITLNSGGQWGNFGFDIGTQATLFYRLIEDDGNTITETNNQINFTIDLILGDTIEYSGGQGFEDIDYEIIPTDRGTERITNVIIFSETEFEGARIVYGHIANQNVNSDNLNSFIDGTRSEVGYVGLNISPFNEWRMMDLFGLQSGMSIRSGRIRRIPNPNPLGASISRYDIPEVSFPLSTLRSQSTNVERTRRARVFQMALTDTVSEHRDINNGVSPSLIPVDNQGNLFTGQADQMFIQNSQTSFAQFYVVEIQFAIINSLSGFSGDSVALVLHRYNGASNYDPVERITLQRFFNTESLVGEVINIQTAKALFVNTGDSYALALEYSNDNPNEFVSRTINIGGFQGTIRLFDEIQEDYFKRFYELEIEYQIASFFGQPDDILERNIPDFLVGDGSLTDNFDVRFFPQWNNPNTIVRNILEETRRLGNTGWFDENYNQLDNDFQVQQVSYKDLQGNIVQSMDYISPTMVEIRVSGVQNLNADSRFGFGFMWIPTNQEDYSDLETPFYRNTFISNGSYEEGYELSINPNPTVFPGAGLNGGSIDVKNIHYREENGILIFSALFQPNVSFASQFQEKEDNDRNYVLWLSIDDSSAQARNFSNRVSLIVDVDNLVENIPPAGPYDLTTRFIEHPFNENAIGSNIYTGIVQDDILVRSRFTINRDDNIRFQRMNFVVEMENEVTKETFELENIPVDLSQFPNDADGFQVFNIDQTRGFRLNQGNNKNFVQVKVDSNSNSNNSNQRNYIALYGFKIRYEDWIERLNVPGSFFDENEGSNGLSNDWYDYVNTPNSDWKIKFSIYILADQDGSIALFRNSYDFNFTDYEQNENVSTIVRYFRDLDDEFLNVGNDPETGQTLGVILNNEFTRIEMNFIIQDDGVWTSGQNYAVNTIEIDRGGGIFEMHQLSSVYDRESTNPLKPIEGEDNLFIEIDSGGKILTTKCLVDPNLLQDAVRYRITGRVGCFEGQDNQESGIYESAYESAYE